MPDHNWNPPYDWEAEEALRPPLSLFITGLASLAISSLLYSSFVYFVMTLLHDAAVINGRISWTHTCLAVTFLNVVRLWDRALFRK